MNKFMFKILLFGLLALTSWAALAQTVQAEDRPSVIKAVAPKYPDIAIAAKATGKVVVKVTLNSVGEVSEAKAISGHPLLQQSSSRAAKRWLFSSSEKKETKRFVYLEFIYTAAAKKEEAGVFFMPPFQVEVIGYPGEINY